MPVNSGRRPGIVESIYDYLMSSRRIVMMLPHDLRP